MYIFLFIFLKVNNNFLTLNLMKFNFLNLNRHEKSV